MAIVIHEPNEVDDDVWSNKNRKKAELDSDDEMSFDEEHSSRDQSLSTTAL